MQPLVVLLVTFAAVSFFTRRSPRRPSLAWRGRFAMAVMLLFTGAAHFFMTSEMAEMIPPPIPNPVAVVILTGVLEILGAIGLLTRRFHRAASWSLILFLLAVFPANVYATLHGVGVGGHDIGAIYLIPRTLLQLMFIGWIGEFGLGWFGLGRRR